MEDSKLFKYTKSVFNVPLIAIMLIWFVYVVEIVFGFNFNQYGIFPRSIKGLRGIFFSPFIHVDSSHLFNNTIPFAVLLAFLFFFYKKIAVKTLFIGTLFTGFMTWVIARNSYHIGASGIIYMLFSFIFFSGIFRKHFRLVALSLIVVFLYGSMIWYILPIKTGVSWEGHLSGFVSGLVLAIFLKKNGPQKTEYIYKKTDFDLMFDENGNYIPPIENEEME